MSAPNSDFPPPHPLSRAARLALHRGSALPGVRPGHGGGLIAPTISGGPDTFTLLKALKRRWMVAACLGVVAAAAAGAAAWFLLSPRFTVIAQLQVQAERPRIVPRNQHERDTSPAVLRTQVASIKRRDVLMKALKSDEVKNLRIVREQPDPLLWLYDELVVKYPEGSEIIDVAMVGNEPDQMIPLLNGLTEAYLLLTVDAEREGRINQLRGLEEANTKANDKLRKLRETLAKNTKDVGTSQSPIAAVMQAETIKTHSEATKEHKRIKGELARLDKFIEDFSERVRKLDDLPILESELQDVIDADPKLKEYAIKKAGYQEFVDRWEPVLDKNNAFLRRAREGLNKSDSLVEERRTAVRNRIVERARSKARAEHEATLAQAQQTRPTWDDQEKAAAAEVERLSKKISEIGNVSTEMEMLHAEIKQEADLVSELGQHLNVLRVEIDVAPRVRLYQPAAVQKKDIKRQVLATIAAPILALVGVCFCVGWWEYRARRIHSAEEVVQSLGLQLVGSVPPMAHPRQAALGTPGEPLEHELIESVDAIRTTLLREASVSETRVVMVTSATSGEGKTTLAGHLAVSLARVGRRTLLIDCDLRRPTAHQLFEQTLQPGLSEVLLNEIDVAEAIRPTTAMENLALLPAGQWDREVLKALAQDGFSILLDRLREEYDFIVIDSSPVLAATDALVIGQHVDAVLLSLMRDVSQVPPVNAAAQRLTALGIRVLGAVVNGLSSNIAYSKSYQNAGPVPLNQS